MHRLLRSRIAVPGVTLALVSILSCSKDTGVAPPVPASVDVTPGADTLATLGRTRQFSAVARDANGNPVTVPLTWRSSNPAVARVDSITGIVTAVANGQTSIRADAGGVSGQAAVVVAQVVAIVVVSPPSAGFTAVGDTQRLAGVAKDSSGAIIQGVRFVWQSSDPSVATVDTGGLLRSKGPGQTFITAAGRGIPGYAVVSVTQTAARLVFAGTPPDITAGDLFPAAIQVEVRDSNNALVTGARTVISIAVDSGPAGALVGAQSVGAVGGVATFAGLAYTGFSGSHTLKATAAGVGNGESPRFAVAPAATATITSLGSGTDGIVGDTLGSWAFELRDRFGNLTDTPDTVRLGTVSVWGSHARGPAAVVPVNGVATFSGFTMDRPGTGVRLTATQGSVTSFASAASFTDTMPSLTEIATSGTHMCAVGDARVFCWGANDGGQLGDGTLLADSVPVLVGTPVTLSGIAAGGSNSCGLSASGAAYCWGERHGYGIFDTQPLLVPGGFTFTKLVAGGGQTCGLTPSGALACWGDDQVGELGDGLASGGATMTPVVIAGGTTFTDVSAGGLTTCAVATGGAAYCWGSGYFGGLGTGSTANDSVPTAVLGGHLFTAISVGTDHTCGLATDSLAYCWGANDGGQLGDSTMNADSVPVAVFGGIKFAAISAGWGGTCALDSAHEVYCWGGVGLASVGIVPTDIGLSGDAVVAGLGNGCVLSTGTLACWGQNDQFQMGDGTRTFGTLPHPIITQTRRRS
ncbi:MAG TPA: Ig-like domain-containing protein [Gemmatimonadales bacterium]